MRHLLQDSIELRETMAAMITDNEVHAHLVQRHGLTAEVSAAWRDRALSSLRETGHYGPPVAPEPVAANLVALLTGDQILDFFSGMSEDLLRLIAERLIHKTSPPG